MTLDQAAPHQTVFVSHTGAQGFLHQRLLDLGFVPGTKVTIKRVAPPGDPIEVCLRGYQLMLRRAQAQEITVYPGS